VVAGARLRGLTLAAEGPTGASPAADPGATALPFAGPSEAAGAAAPPAPAGRPRRRILRVTLAVLALLALAVVVLNWTYGRLPSEPPPRGSFARVDGLRIHYIERRGPGVPVLAIHGLPGTAEDFNDVTALLGAHRTIAIDRPGFGYSPGGYVKIDRQLQAIHDLLGRLGIARAIVVGHSYGGTIALGFAERYPAQVRGLVLADAAAAGAHPSSSDRLQAHLVNVLQLPVVRQLADVTFSQLFRTVAAEQGDEQAFSPQPVADAHLHRLLAINMTSGNLEAFGGETLAAGGVISQVDRGLGSIAAPAVVVQGDRDRLVAPIYGRRLAAALPHGRLVLVSGGHMTPYTHPQAIASAVASIG
jgi:pimeloyl-ACP methyl ester carboxylesterase